MERLGSFQLSVSRSIGAAMTAAVVLIVCAFAQTAPAAAAPLSIKVEGNHLVNGAGQTIRLLGVNRPSAEYACVDGFGYNDGHFDDADAAAIASWNADAVRVPLNEDCWLGINGQPNNNEEPSFHPSAVGYREMVESYVAALNAHGLYAILDLHWSAPGAQMAMEQQPMPDFDHSPDFWSSVASTFKNDPAVVFDLFNEPFDPTDERSGDDETEGDKVTWECWDTGTKKALIGGGAPNEPCVTNAYDQNENPTTHYRIAGMQELVNTIRATGATQPVMAGGLDFANDLSQWVAHKPFDPLNQEAASFHNYMGKECDNVGCWNSEIAPVAANVPVVTGEFAQEVCAPNNFDSEYMEWADAHGVSYLAWAWIVLSPDEIASEGCSAYTLISDYGYTPAAPNGTAVRNHLLTLPPGGLTQFPLVAAPTPTPPPTGGSKKAIALTAFHAHVKVGGAAIIFKLRSAQNCKGRLTGQTTKPFATGSKGRKRKVALGSVNFKLVAGKAKSVVLKLSGPPRALLKAKGSLAVRFTVTLSGGGTTTVLHPTATLKEPAAHRSGH
jgi:endoglucanase